MKLILLGELRRDCGSISAFRGYARAGRILSIPVQVADTRKVTASWLKAEARAADYVLWVIEHRLCKNYDQLVAAIPVAKRVLVDVDITLSIGTSDQIKRLRSDFPVILQPTTRKPAAGIYSFPFFGYDLRHESTPLVNKQFDLVYVGNNWFRWTEMVEVVEACRKRGTCRALRIGLFGKWWTGACRQDLTHAVRSDPSYLAAHAIQVHAAVNHSRLYSAMSSGWVNAVLKREDFRREAVITPRIFETLAADTFPIYPNEDESLLALFGERASDFLPMRGNDLGSRFQDMLAQPHRYAAAQATLRAVAREHHTYERRLDDLVTLLRNTSHE